LDDVGITGIVNVNIVPFLGKYSVVYVSVDVPDALIWVMEFAVNDTALEVEVTKVNNAGPIIPVGPVVPVGPVLPVGPVVPVAPVFAASPATP